MKFEWHESKNSTNKSKHGLSFETASFIFDDPFLVSVLDERHQGEERWRSVGLVKNTVVYVAHTVSEDEHEEEIIRIISARAATANEAKYYYLYRSHGK